MHNIDKASMFASSRLTCLQQGVVHVESFFFNLSRVRFMCCKHTFSVHSFFLHAHMQMYCTSRIFLENIGWRLETSLRVRVNFTQWSSGRVSSSSSPEKIGDLAELRFDSDRALVYSAFLQDISRVNGN